MNNSLDNKKAIDNQGVTSVELRNIHNELDSFIPSIVYKGEKYKKLEFMKPSFDFDDDDGYAVPDQINSDDDDEISLSSREHLDQVTATEYNKQVKRPKLIDGIEHVDICDRTCSTISSSSFDSLPDTDTDTGTEESTLGSSFLSFRFYYLLVMLLVMLADGLQITHLYVLYEGYGFSVSSLYCLGFVTGGLFSPITGPVVDKLGRKKSALLYCFLEIIINRLEQYPIFTCLVFSRMIGGVTTNLLSTVFEAWLDTEYRKRGFEEKKYEILMRDSSIVSNLAAIGAGCLGHVLAEHFGPVGPFKGAVSFTCIALVVIVFAWTENYGDDGDTELLKKEQNSNQDQQHHRNGKTKKGLREFLEDAIALFRSDSKVLCVGVVQGLTCASIDILDFLWSPALRHFAKSAPSNTIGLDSDGEPAYGLLFGAFMASGALGSLCAPWFRKLLSSCFFPFPFDKIKQKGVQTIQGRNRKGRPMAVELLAACCYFVSAASILIPCLLSSRNGDSFSICLKAFLLYEFSIGLCLPCEGMIRSLYFPSEGRASIMTLPRVIVNVMVSLGVAMTKFVTMKASYSFVFVLLSVSGFLQLSLISKEQWKALFRSR